MSVTTRAIQNSLPVLHFSLVHHLLVGKLLSASAGRQQVDEKGEYVEGEDDRDDPFEHGADVQMACEHRRCHCSY